MTTTPTSWPPQAPLAIAMPDRHPLSKMFRDGEYPVVPEPIQRLLHAEDQIRIAVEEEIKQAPEPLPALMQRVTGELIAGGTLPDDFAGIAERSVGREATVTATNNVLRGIAKRIADVWPGVLGEAADEVLGGLAERLQQLLYEVRTAAAVITDLDLNDTEAVGAASTKQRSAIGDLSKLRPRYGRLRGLQEALLKRLDHDRPPVESDLPSWNYVTYTDPAGDPTFLRNRLLGLHEFSDVKERGRPAEQENRALWFRPLLKRDDLWLPTLTQMREAVTVPKRPSVPHSTSDPYKVAVSDARDKQLRTALMVAEANTGGDPRTVLNNL